MITNHSTAYPKVSVIMNCYNCSKYLREAIDSVYSQTYKDWEIIFWDDASTDNSAEIATGYDGRLRYFRGDKAASLHAARNLALREARGEYIAFLDCDDMWLPEKLEMQVPLFEKDRKIGLVYSNGYKLDHQGLTRVIYKKIQPSGNIFRKLLGRYNLCLPTVMISKEALDSLGHWFDESFRISGDSDLFLRIAHNWEAIYAPAVTAIYREHGGNLHLSNEDIIPVEREYIIKKFSEIDSNFLRKYRVEIVRYRMHTQNSLIISMLKNGEVKELRQIVLNILKSIKSFVFLYALSFFPYSSINYIRNVLYKIKMP